MNKLYTYLLLLPSLLFSQQLFAQLNYYPGGFATTAGTYTDLGSNGTVITLPNQDDAFSAPLPIGFTFNFNGAPYDSFVFSTNGFIKLGVDSPSRHFLFTTHAQPPANGPFTSTTSPTPAAKDTSMLFAFGQDLFPGTNVSEYRYFTSGLPGTQVLTVQWKNVKDKLQATVGGLWDTINFQIKLYEGSNIIEYQYGKWTSTVSLSAARFSAVGIVGKSMTTANQNLHLVKGSTVVWSGAVANTGFYVNNAVNYRNPTSSPAGPAPDNGRSYIFAPLALNDASVRAVYAQGRVALPFYRPDSISANIINTGVNTLTNLTVTLTITGANNYITTATIPSLAPSANTNISFAPFYPTSTGQSLITVSVPSDDNNTNNTKSYSFSVNNNRHSYVDTLLPSSGGNGTTAPNFWGAKYFIANSGMVTQVRSPLASNSDAVGDTVCGVVMDSNGLVLARSPGYIVQTSDLGTTLVFNMTMPAVVSNQSIIVGIAGCQSVNSLNYFLGTSQTENPLRPIASFYFMTQNGTTAPGGITGLTVGQSYATPVTWTSTRLMMDCNVEPLPPVDAGVVACGPAPSVKVPTGVAIPLRAVVKNLGTQIRPAGIPVRYRINNGPILGPVNTTAAMAPGDTTSVLFSGASAMTFASPGSYTIKIYTSLTGDALPGNDTLNAVYNAVAPQTLPYRVANSFLSTWTTQNNSPAIWKEKTAVQANGVSSGGVLYAENVINSSRQTLLLSPPITLSGITNPVLHFNVAYAPNTMTGLDDTLEVWVSTDGGLSFSSVYLKSGQLTTPTLGTDTPTSGAYTPAFATDWRHESVSLSAFAGNPYVVIAFRDKCQSGNNLYIGNLSLTSAANHYVQSVYGTGTYTNANLSVSFSSIGSAAGEIAITRYNGAAFSSAAPVFATNTSATSNSSVIFTPNNVNQNGWYSVTYSGIGTGNYSPTVQYTLAYDLSNVYGIPSRDSLYLMRRSDFNGSWVAIPSYVSGNYLFSGSISGFSDFTLGSVSSVNPLPVSWLSFSGKLSDRRTVDLAWSTASETGSSRFIVERSTDNQRFEEAGSVEAAGNSRTARSYTFRDVLRQPVENVIYYRLRQEDRDGSFSYSRTLTLGSRGVEQILTVQVVNPYTGIPELITESQEEGSLQLTVMDLGGKPLGTENVALMPGIQRHGVAALEHLPAGIYLLQVSKDGISQGTYKVLKVN